MKMNYTIKIISRGVYIITLLTSIITANTVPPFGCQVHSANCERKDSVPINGRCYTWYLIIETWENAKKTCEAKGSVLAVVDTRYHMSMLWNYVQPLYGRIPYAYILRAWIGANKNDETGMFHWIFDNTTFNDTSLMAFNQPYISGRQRNCLAYNFTHGIMEEECENHNTVLCMDSTYMQPTICVNPGRDIYVYAKLQEDVIFFVFFLFYKPNISNVTFTLNGQSIVNSDKYEINVSRLINNSFGFYLNVTIKNVEVKDYGYYVVNSSFDEIYHLILSFILTPLHMGINNETAFNEEVISVESNATILLKCAIEDHNISHSLSLKFYDDVLYNDNNTIVHTIHNIKCSDRGIYSCGTSRDNIEFIYTEISLYLYVEECRVPLVISANNETLEYHQNVIIDEGSNLILKCFILKGSHKSTLAFYKNDALFLVNRTHELEYVIENVECNDSGVYICRHYLQAGTILHEVISIINVNCSLFIKSFVSVAQKVVQSGNVIKEKGSSLILQCLTETYYFKTNLTIKRHGHGIKRATPGLNFVVLIKQWITCQDIGLYTCELEDISRQITYKENIAIWITGCPQYLCEQENISSVFFVSQLRSVTVDICFNMLQEDSFKRLSISKNRIWIQILNTTKYNYNIRRIVKVGHKYLIHFKMFNVAEDDIGENSLELLFMDGNFIIYNFSIYKSDTEFLPDDTVLLLEIGLPVIIITILTALGLILCLFISRRENGEKNTQSHEIHQSSGSSDYQFIDELNMITINEDDDCYNKIVDAELDSEIMETNLSLSSQSNSLDLPSSTSCKEMFNTPQEVSHSSLKNQINNQIELTSFKTHETEIMNDYVLTNNLEDKVVQSSDILVANPENVDDTHKNLVKNNAPENVVVTDSEYLRKDRLMTGVDRKGYSTACEVYTDHTYLTLTNMNMDNIVLDKLEPENNVALVGEETKRSPLESDIKYNDGLNITNSHNFLVDHSEQHQESFTEDISQTLPNVTLDGQNHVSAYDMEFDEYITPKTPKISNCSLKSSHEIPCKFQIACRNITDENTESYIDFDGCDGAKLDKI